MNVSCAIDDLLSERLKAARWRHSALLGTPGFGIPFSPTQQAHDLESRHLPSGIRVECRPGTRGIVLCPAEFRSRLPLSIVVHRSAEDLLLVIGPDTPITGQIVVIGARATIVLAGGPGHASQLGLTMWRADQLFYMGAGSTTNGMQTIMHGDDRCVIIGEDCMFANDVTIRSSDMHGIIDMETGRQSVCHGDVLVEPHVWVGQDTLILKDVTLGFGSVIGAKSLVSRPIPRFCVAAGQPARSIRQNASWNRSDEYDPDLTTRLRAMAQALQTPSVGC